jgi:hypothetical protein
MPTDNDDVLPSRDEIAERLEAVRKAIWHVQGICGLAARAGHYFHDDGLDSPTEFATNVWTALEGVDEMLGGVTGALEPDVLLRPSEVKEVQS